MVTKRVTRSRTSSVTGKKRPMPTEDVDVGKASKLPARDLSPAQEEEVAVEKLAELSDSPTSPITPPLDAADTNIDYDAWRTTTEHYAPLLAELLKPASTIESQDQKKFLHHAILAGWPEEMLRAILSKLTESNTKKLLTHNNYYSVSTEARLASATTPAFWKLVFELFPEERFDQLCALGQPMQELGHLCFSEETWIYLLNCHRCNAAESIIGAFYRTRCYATILPTWFISALLAAGDRAKCLTPYHYYSTRSYALGAYWDEHYPHVAEEVKEKLKEQPAEHKSLLLDLVTPGSAHVCDIKGFQQAFTAMTPDQRDFRGLHSHYEGEFQTGFDKLKGAWESRKRVMLPLTRMMRTQFEFAIHHLENKLACSA